MTKIRTLAHLQESLDSELGWRIKEISTFKIAAKRGDGHQRAYVRAGVALVYAHWEGFIKRASEAYLSYVATQNHKCRELKSCFAVFGLKGKLDLLAVSRQSAAYIEAFEFVLNEMDKPAKLSMASAIDTESNLTSLVFANIASSLDISTSWYETKYKLIDESLVHRRNQIAHGEYLDLSVADFSVLADDVVSLMRAYKSDLENAASLGAYKRV